MRSAFANARIWRAHGLAVLCCVALALTALPAMAQEPFEAIVRPEKAVRTEGAPKKSTPRVPKQGKKSSDDASKADEQVRARHNQWTVGIAAGLPEDSISLYAADLAKALDDGENLRVLPIASYGAAGNVRDLLFLNGADAAITYVDSLAHARDVEKVPDLDKRLSYVMPMFQAELHVLVRPEIKSIADLAGRKVAFDTQGNGANVTGGIVLERLGVGVDKVYLNSALALAAMAKGEIAALVHVATKPGDLLARLHPELGYHLLPVEYSDNLQDHYVPATLTSAEYPNLIPDGSVVRTISVQAVLIVPNAAPDSDRHRRNTRLVEHLFANFDRLRSPPFQPGWGEMNPAGAIPGWTRFAPAQELLAKAVAQSDSEPALARKHSPRVAPGSRTTEQEKLFQQFMRWSKQQRRE
jgi:TRAP-type uncharacterized transport system substrate-binding protein